MPASVKIALLIVLPPILLTTVILIQNVEPEQIPPEMDMYQFPDTLANYDHDLDSILEIIGDNKGLPPGFELAGAIAYSAYPELRDVKIDMILTEKGAPMESNFNLWTMFLPGKGNRMYEIFLNNAENTYFDPILLRALPFDAQVGILAHELGHVVYYHRLNLLQIGKWGLKYIQDREFRAIHERTTDMMPVYHGLGSQIYQYAYFVRRDSTTRGFYKNDAQFMDFYYMTDTELRKALDARK